MSSLAPTAAKSSIANQEGLGLGLVFVHGDHDSVVQDEVRCLCPAAPEREPERHHVRSMFSLVHVVTRCACLLDQKDQGPRM